jgi:hypothetical protein
VIRSPLIALAIGAAFVGLAAPAAGYEARPAPERVMVRGAEFSLVLSRPRIRPGPAIIQFVNAGEDPHDLRVQRTGDAEFGVGEIGPGEYANLAARLRRRSTYVLWCSLSDHRELGMEATLRTRKRRR